MRRFSAITLGLLALFAMLPYANAGTFDIKHVPADAKWLVHVDVDSIRQSKIWDMLRAKLGDENDLVKFIELPQYMPVIHAVHDVTVLGREFNGQNVVAIFRAEMDMDAILQFLHTNPTYQAQAYGKHDIHEWEDKGKTIVAGIFSPTVFVLGPNRKAVESGLDVLDGKSPAIDAKSPLLKGKADDQMVYVAGDGLQDLPVTQQVFSPLMKQIGSAWLALAETKEQASICASVAARTPEAAKQMRAALDGIRAIVTLTAAGPKADANAKTLAEVLQAIQITSSDLSVQLSWSMPVETIHNLLQKVTIPAKAAQPAEEPAPANKPQNP